MIVVVYGTTGELIKIGPLLRTLERRGVPAITMTTGQQVEQIGPMLEAFGLCPPTIWLGRGRGGRDLRRVTDLPAWGTQVVRRFARVAPRLRSLRPSLLLVHGDTMTTVLGAAMGRMLRLPVAHVEAGLRSGDWLNPFPEELNRHAASRLTSLHFAPNAWAADNLRRAGIDGEIVVTGGNTMIDSLRLFGDRPIGIDLPDGPFGLASIHRQELLGKPSQLKQIVDLLLEAASERPVLFVDHPITAAALQSAGLDSAFDGHRLRRIPRQPYGSFIALLRRSSWLVTDSGGSQEECAQLGIPCLIHRRATERLEGLDENVVLSRMEPDAVRRFLRGWSSLARPAAAPEASPTAVIVEALAERGHLTG